MMAGWSVPPMSRSITRPRLIFVSVAGMVLLHDPIADLESLLVADGAGQAEVDADEHARGRIFLRRVRNPVERAWADRGKRRCHRAGESEVVFVSEERDKH